MASKIFFRDFLAGISLANLAFLHLWSQLLTSSISDGYTMRYLARPVDLAAAMIDVVLLGVSIAGAAWAVRGWKHGAAVLRWGIVVSLLFPVNALRIALYNHASEGTGPARQLTLKAATLLCAVSLIYAAKRWRDGFARRVSHVLLITSPFVVVTFSQAALKIASYNPAPFAEKGLLARPAPAGAPTKRVLWLIFDEMDERLTFVNPGARSDLSELNRFRRESFVATRAYSPSNKTLSSMPALITGKLVADAQQIGPDDLLLRFPSGTSGRWAEQPNVFSRARQAGFETALAGWFHPYGRVLNTSLTECAWADRAALYNSTGDSLREVVFNQLRSLMETTQYSPFGQSLIVQHHARSYRSVRNAAMRFSSAPELGFVLVHFPIPHGPYFYNAETGAFDLRYAHTSAYMDALALADRTLGDLRRKMEAAGTWERTTVLISADHGYRSPDTPDGRPTQQRWVPFLLKLAGQHRYYEYSHSLETVHSAGLLLHILQHDVQSPAEIAAWLDRSDLRQAAARIVMD